jgi:hypothetical protein
MCRIIDYEYTYDEYLILLTKSDMTPCHFICMSNCFQPYYLIFVPNDVH